MKFGSQPARSILAYASNQRVHIVDQTLLPFSLEERTLTTWEQCAEAIRVMRVRGAPLIGVTAAYGMALAASKDATDTGLRTAHDALMATRPTAVNLAWALNRMNRFLETIDPAERSDAAWEEAARIEAEDVSTNRQIGEHGLALIRALHEKLGRPVNVLTHCNAGRMACVEWGTATAPIYLAKEANIPVHVYVEETRPRNQGLLTQWELENADVPHTYIVDNAGGHLMQQGKVDIVFVGADRVSIKGDVANKIGTYLKALAARDCKIPFYAAVPISTIDSAINSLDGIEIEERSADEVRRIRGLGRDDRVVDVRLLDDDVKVANPGFDVTPARLVTGIITESGVFAPKELTPFIKSVKSFKSQQQPAAAE
jgi:methylthioribose-1-phosphate isomerase